jgi:hypothetical protein
MGVGNGVARKAHSTGFRLPVRFYSVVAATLWLIVLIGFSRTFFLRAFFNVPNVPAYVLVHGAVLTAWFTGLLVQTVLVAARRTQIHSGSAG